MISFCRQHPREIAIRDLSFDIWHPSRRYRPSQSQDLKISAGGQHDQTTKGRMMKNPSWIMLGPPCSFRILYGFKDLNRPPKKTHHFAEFRLQNCGTWNARRKKGWSLTVLRQCSLYRASKFIMIIILISCCVTMSTQHMMCTYYGMAWPGRSIDTPWKLT